MKASELRQSILQAAVQGKLVLQDLHDEPALELLGRIRAEKAKLVKDGKIKKEKSLPIIAEDETPYELPDGWIWCRLGDVITLVSGQHIESKDYNDMPVGTPYLTGPTDFGERYTVITKWTTVPKVVAHEGDLLITVKGSGVGSLNFLSKTAAIGRQLMAIQVIAHSIGFLYYFMSYSRTYFSNKKAGIAIPGISREDILYTLYPLPPLIEQKRIVAKVDELMAMCDDLEAAEGELETLEEHFIESLPKSILQMAVQGKLVPQDLYDEPASELLECIRTEKAKLVKKGKIKREKPLPPITEDEIPYDLPDGWVWCRLSEIADFKIGKTPARADSDYWEDGIYPWVSIADMKSGQHLAFTKECITQRAYDDVFKGAMVPAGSLLFSFKLSIGKVSILDIDAFTNEAICSIIPYAHTEIIEYLFRVFPALDLLAEANDAVKGRTLNSKSIANILIPLPPLSEQQRIIKMVDELTVLCSQLKIAKTEPVRQANRNTVQFPQVVEQEEIGLAARGDGTSGLSEKARQDADELLGDG